MVGLLGDDSPAVVSAVRRELETADRLAVPFLRRAARDERAVLRARARAVLADRDRRATVRRLLRYACGPNVDLETGLFLLGGFDRPRLDARPYRRALDAMGREVVRRMQREPEGFARPMVLAHYLGNERGLIGSEVDYHHPDHVYLHRAIVRKRGMPLTLTAIYLLVARRAGIRAAAVPLPGHVLLRLYSGRRSLIIDPFRGGRVRTRSDCLRYLAEQGLVPRPSWFRDATDAMLLQRHARNLMNSYQLRGRARLARDLERVAQVLGRFHTRLPESPRPA